MIKELNYIQDIHCQKCCVQGSRPELEYLYPYSNKDRLRWKRNFVLTKGCRFLQLYSDRILAVGADSFVLESDSGEYIFKLYPEHNLKEIQYYQKETNRLSRELEGKKLLVSDKFYKINICKIEDVVELPRGCLLATQKFIPGPHGHDRLMTEYNNKPERDVTRYSEFVNKLINKHYKKIALSNHICPEDFYIFSENFKVDENNSIIHITDLACKIGSWTQRVSTIRGDTF